VIIAAAVTAHHHLDPRLAATIGSAIMANGNSQEKGPILSNTGSKGFTDFGSRIALHTKSKHATPIHPGMLIRC
jgi:hypothetical protein